jgi:ankyrin repeat protein
VQKNPPTRALRERPDLDQLRRQAKELLDAFRTGDARAAAEVTAHYREADAASFALHDAQLVLARAYGFDSWPKLKAYVDGITVKRLVEAVRGGDLAQVRIMLKARPEMATMGIDNYQVLHFAVLDRAPEMVRILMEHNADARAGVYPHRDATSALTIATERGYDEIVAIIVEAEQRRRNTKSGLDAAPAPDEMTARSAVALGDADWLRARQAEGVLVNAIDGSGGLLKIACSHNRPETLALLLDFGFDPDERVRIEGTDDLVFSWGMPLWHCAGTGKLAMAEMLLSRGADPNAQVYASGTPVFQAYSQADWNMVELLGRYGGEPQATTAGLYRQSDLARRMLDGKARYRMDGVGGETLAEQLLWGAACGGDPEIVAMALEHVDWPRDDPRWFAVLEQPLRIWSHGSGSRNWDRGTYLTCFRQVLERCDANIRGRTQDQGRFGLTILHSVAGSREHVTAEERTAFATMLLDAGARVDLRDNLLMSTPLGWACRWGRGELVELLLERDADPIESDALPWATPRAWAEKMGHDAVLALLRDRDARDQPR